MPQKIDLKKKMQSRKQRINISLEDENRLCHIAQANELGGYRELSRACRLAIRRTAKNMLKKNVTFAKEIEEGECGELLQWGFQVRVDTLEHIGKIMKFHGLRYISSAVRLAIRLQAKSDGFKEKK